MVRRIFLMSLWAVLLVGVQCNIIAKQGPNKKKKYMSFKGLVMAGYQGWFNAEGDGADRGWNHYKNRNNLFEPGNCKIDMWPDITEYAKKYKTAFKYDNGDPAYVFSVRTMRGQLICILNG